jgi:hypothetical protein
MSAPEILNEVLKFIGGVAAIGGTAAAAAYAIFRIFTTKWIDRRFSERLEAFKHQQNQEIEHLRFRINTMMDRTVKLHQREFEVLPEMWGLLTHAFYTIEPVAFAVQQYPDLDNMSAERIDEFLDQSPLTVLEKTELKEASDKKKYYAKVKLSYDLNNAVEVYNDYHAKFTKNGIFIMEPIKLQFALIDQMLKSAIIERQVQPHKFDEASKLNSKGRELLGALGNDVQRRLWNSELAEDASH